MATPYDAGLRGVAAIFNPRGGGWYNGGMKFSSFVNGEWARGGDEVANINPSDIRETVGVARMADAKLATQAVGGARAAQPQWAAAGIESRCDILKKIGDELIARKDELGELLAREEGKTRGEGIGEVDRAGRFFHYFSGEALRNIGDFVDSVRGGVEVEVMRQPLGVVAVITPWNFPSALPAWKIAPALAFGNAVVFKPAALTPASACALVEVCHNAGVPAGVVQLLLGAGREVGAALLQNADVDAVSFTGSLPTGRVVAEESAKHLRRFQLEMGSKNALVIAEDADLDAAAACAVNGAFFGTGQKCTASSRIIVCDAVYESFRDKFVAATRALKVGHALAADTNIGPCVSEQQMQKNARYVESAQAEGAKLLYRGELGAMAHEGYYFAPVIFDETHNDMAINREEVFGPITCLLRAADYEDALRLCNDSAYGLTAGIVTASLKYAAHFKRHAQAGCVMVNLPTAGTDYHVPFGGTKLSSFGPREQGQYAIEFYTKIKTAYIKA